MKITSFLTFLIVLLMFFNVNAQKVAYTGLKSPKKIAYKSEKLTLSFFDTGTPEFIRQRNPSSIEALGPQLLPLIPTLFDLGVKISTNQLEKKEKKYTGEYFARNSKIMEHLMVPGVKVIRSLDGSEVFNLELTPIRLKKRDAFVYFVSNLEVKKSKAFAKTSSRHMDYSIQLTPILADKTGKKTEQKVSPITITGLQVGNALAIENNEYRSDIIPLSEDMELVEMTVKIIESNPDVVKLEDIRNSIDTYKDDAKTIINYFLDGKEGDTATEDTITITDNN